MTNYENCIRKREYKVRIPEIIKEEEFIQLLKGVKKKHHKLAYIMGFYQCMRVSEVIKLLPENVHLERHVLEIKMAKGGKDRNIPISPELSSLRGFMNYLPLKCGIRALEIAFKKEGKKTLNKNLHFHILRHSGATHYLNVKKWNIRQVQVFLGHSRLSTTEIYTHVQPEDLINIMWNNQKDEKRW